MVHADDFFVAFLLIRLRPVTVLTDNDNSLDNGLRGENAVINTIINKKITPTATMEDIQSCKCLSGLKFRNYDLLPMFSKISYFFVLSTPKLYTKEF